MSINLPLSKKRKYACYFVLACSGVERLGRHNTE